MGALLVPVSSGTNTLWLGNVKWVQHRPGEDAVAAAMLLAAAGDGGNDVCGVNDGKNRFYANWLLYRNGIFFFVFYLIFIFFFVFFTFRFWIRFRFQCDYNEVKIYVCLRSRLCLWINVCMYRYTPPVFLYYLFVNFLFYYIFCSWRRQRQKLEITESKITL